MKNWILSHKILSIVLACVIGAGAVCAVVLPIALRHEHEFSAEWTKDENYHWHKCNGEKCDEVSDKAAHVFDKEVASEDYFASAATYTEAAKYYKSCVCGAKGNETFSYGSSLAAKENVVSLKEGVTLGKTYDGTACILSDEQISRNGNGAITFMYKLKDSEAEFGETAPEKAGEYTVKVSVAATAEWKACDKTFDFTIAKKELTARASKEYDGTDAISNVILDGVCEGDDVSASITMASKNVGATVKEVMLAGAAKDNYTLSASGVNASITAKALTASASKVYDGTNTIPDVIPDGVREGEEVKVIIFMASKNVGASVTSLLLEGADKDNYKIEQANVTASITPIVITVEWEKKYNNSKILTGDPTKLLEGDEATITVTMESANVGAKVQSFELTGKDAGNYSLAREDVTAEIVKADINFEISNASAFTEFFVGATNIPDPTTNYDEIGTGYGAKTIVWEKRLEGGVWSRTLTKEEVRNEKTGTYRVRVQYAEGTNYHSAATEYVGFTVKVKPRILNVMNFDGKTYDGTPVANFNYDALEDTVEITDLPGVNDLTSPYDGEKYLEFRKKGEEIYTKVTSTYIPKNAAEYEYRIGIKATDEWEAVVSDIKSFTISQVEIKLEKGYVATSAILQNGELLYLASHSPVADEKVALRLVNGKAGLELSPTNSNYVKLDQKKMISVQNNLDCFKLVAISTTNVSNYKIVKDAKLTSVEITVPPSENGTSNQITGKSESTDTANNRKQLSMWTTVNKGYFQVGQTVIVRDSTGTKLLEAKIIKVGVVDPDRDGTFAITSQSGCVIPSDGKVRIDIDVTGITYDVNKVVGGTVKVK
ncbi:MAG: YDG domain-containing protein [Clostridiales bacterium]|nr:YDG domain-containing protein [Clostridiales bacterium]